MRWSNITAHVNEKKTFKLPLINLLLRLHKSIYRRWHKAIRLSTLEIV